MPKTIFNKFLPSDKKIRENKTLKKFGKRLNDPKLWGVNRRSISLGFGFGIFVAMLPIPMQMFAVILFALYFKFNIPISVSLVWITNPVTMPFIFYFEYLLGSFILDQEVSEFCFKVEWITENMDEIGLSLYFGAIITGIILGTLSYFTVNYYWNWKLKDNKKKNRLRRKIKKNKYKK